MSKHKFGRHAHLGDAVYRGPMTDEELLKLIATAKRFSLGSLDPIHDVILDAELHAGLYPGFTEIPRVSREVAISSLRDVINRRNAVKLAESALARQRPMPMVNLTDPDIYRQSLDTFIHWEAKAAKAGEPSMPTRKYSLEDLRKLRERGETGTRTDAPEVPLEPDFWEGARVVLPEDWGAIPVLPKEPTADPVAKPAHWGWSQLQILLPQLEVAAGHLVDQITEMTKTIERLRARLRKAGLDPS